MPNWCSNNLTLRHEDPAMIQRAYDAFVRGEFFQEFVPCPVELLETTAQLGTNDQEQENLKNLGYASWYDFNIKNWGTKWDVGGDGCDSLTTPNEFSTSFDTAWSPPIAFYERLLELGFEVNGSYYEPGMAFVGRWVDGNDDYYDYGDLNSQQIAETIPSELDQEFAISESIEMWEEENQDE